LNKLLALSLSGSCRADFHENGFNNNRLTGKNSFFLHKAKTFSRLQSAYGRELAIAPPPTQKEAKPISPRVDGIF
jgi:hypothetical protein